MYTLYVHNMCTLYAHNMNTVQMYIMHRTSGSRVMGRV